MELTRHRPGDAALPGILELIRNNFAYMDGVVDPPSSVHHLSEDVLNEIAGQAEIWSIGMPPRACMILTPEPHALYIGKLCVAEAARSQGLARHLIEHATERAKALKLPALELQTRVELTANHAAFAALGFAEINRTAHAGYNQPTSLTFRKTLQS